MAEKRKRRSLNAIYCKPLPVTLSVDLYGRFPVLTLANPGSWIWMLYHVGSMFLRTPAHLHDKKYEVEVMATQPDVVFQIHKDEDMNSLWLQGFFGKGTLSRSDPTWRQRARNRTEQDNFVTKENVTRARRDDRKTFKSARAQLQQLEALERQRQLTPQERQYLHQIQKQMELLKAPLRNTRPAGGAADAAATSSETKAEATNDHLGFRGGPISEALDVAAPEHADLESLQLQKVELFFLAFALDVVTVVHENRRLTLDETFRVCMRHHMAPDNRFLLEYVAYHHFRSLGWCVKSGIKFGCHMLLYKRGPPFLHAEYAVLVVANDGRDWTSWEDFMAIARVVTGVKKTLVLVYVDMPNSRLFSDMTRGPLHPAAVKNLLRLYKVTEVVYRRWSPSRTRD